MDVMLTIFLPMLPLLCLRSPFMTRMGFDEVVGVLGLQCVCRDWVYLQLHRMPVACFVGMIQVCLLVLDVMSNDLGLHSAGLVWHALDKSLIFDKIGFICHSPGGPLLHVS